MSNPHWMPLYIKDYLADTTHLRTVEHGAYLLLIMHYWVHGGLPDDDAQLCTITKMHPREWSKARSVLQPLFDVGWRHKRIDDELAKARERYERRAAAGRTGGRPKSNAFVMEKQCFRDGVALLNQPHTQREDDNDGDARARDPAFELCKQLGKIAGFEDATYWPPGWLPAPIRVRAFLGAGYTPELMLATAREVMARKKDGSPNSIAYFEKAFACARARQEQPLPVVTTLEPQRTTIDGALHVRSSGQTRSVASVAKDWSERLHNGESFASLLGLPERPVREPGELPDPTGNGFGAVRGRDGGVGNGPTNGNSEDIHVSPVNRGGNGSL
jgi:uncharacterized protein YdaU (DUF1376 family)